MAAVPVDAPCVGKWKVARLKAKGEGTAEKTAAAASSPRRAPVSTCTTAVDGCWLLLPPKLVHSALALHPLGRRWWRCQANTRMCGWMGGRRGGGM